MPRKPTITTRDLRAMDRLGGTVTTKYGTDGRGRASGKPSRPRPRGSK